MSPGTIALIVVAVSVAAWGLFMANITIRRQRQAASTREHPAAGEESRGAEISHQQASAPSSDVTVEKVPETKLKPLTPAQMEVTRRQFLNRVMTASFSAFLGFFGMATL